MTRDAAPSRISTRSMSERFTGKSAALCPVWGLTRGTPLSSRVIWSRVPPSMLMSVCTPNPPRCRTSVAAESFRRSLMEVMPAASRSACVKVVTCRAATLAASGALVAATAASPSCSVSAGVSASRSSASSSVRRSGVAACRRGAAQARVHTPSTPMRTSRPRQLKRLQLLRLNWRKVMGFR